MGGHLFSLSRHPLTKAEALPLQDAKFHELRWEQHLLSYDRDTGDAKFAVLRMYDAEMKIKVVECLSTTWARQLDIDVHPCMRHYDGASKQFVWSSGRLLLRSTAAHHFEIKDFHIAQASWPKAALEAMKMESI